MNRSAAALNARLKDVAQLVDDVLPETTDPEKRFEYVDIGNVNSLGRITGADRIIFRDAPSRARRRVKPGDVILSTVRTYLRAIGLMGEEHADSIVSTGFAVLRAKPVIRPKYLWYLLQSEPFIGRVVSWSEGVSYPAIAPSTLLSLPIRLPSQLELQQSVIESLDGKLAEIDELIARKRRLFELLHEWEQAQLLSILGDWRGPSTKSLRTFGADVVTGPFGTQLSATEYVQGGVPVINPTHIIRGRLIPEDHVSVPESVAQRLARHRFARGDLIVGRKGDVGRAAIVDEKAEGWICGSDSIAVRTKATSLSPKYLALVLHVDLYRQQLAARSTGATLANVNEKTLLSLRLPSMSLEEQHRATTAAVSVMDRYERLAGLIKRQIGLLEEQRVALITAAVTGQMDVRSAA